MGGMNSWLAIIVDFRSGFHILPRVSNSLIIDPSALLIFNFNRVLGIQALWPRAEARKLLPQPVAPVIRIVSPFSK